MRGTIVGNPEDSSCGTIRLLLPDQIHKLVVGFDPSFLFADPEELGPVDIPRGKVGQCAHSLVFKLHAPWLMRLRSRADQHPASGLNTSLFVSADYVVIGSQENSLKNSEVEIQDTSGLFCETLVPWEKPTPILPRLYRVSTEATPDSDRTYGYHDASNQSLSGDVGGTEAGKGEAQCDGEFTGEGFDFYNALRGKKGAFGRSVVGPPDRRVVRRRTVSATSRRLGAAHPGVQRSPRSPCRKR